MGIKIWSMQNDLDVKIMELFKLVWDDGNIRNLLSFGFIYENKSVTSIGSAKLEHWRIPLIALLCPFHYSNEVCFGTNAQVEFASTNSIKIMRFCLDLYKLTWMLMLYNL